MNPVTGRVHFNIGGEMRELACDMRAVAVLWDELGEEWPSWLTERFSGSVIPMDDGSQVRMAAQIPPADLGLALYALLASDRAGRPRIESPSTILELLSDMAEAQVAAMNAVAPGFGVPGDGIERPELLEDEKPKEKRRAGWDWRLVLETAFGLMGLSPDVFWGMTIAEWQCARDGHAARERVQRYGRAWTVSYLLTAQGCDPNNVRPAKLLGEVDDIEREHRRQVAEAVEKAKTQAGPDPVMLRLAHEASGGRFGGDLLAEMEGGIGKD